MTQVVTPFSDRPLIHNRLTHSLKVAQVARSAAEQLLNDTSQHELIGELGGLDVDVCVTAAMAHDIGHPPFGHVGEEILDRIARETHAPIGLGLEDGFEGNAQSLRIVLTGYSRSVEYQGLDLTYASLAAIAKYPWTRATTKPEKAHDRAMNLYAERTELEFQEDALYRRHWRKFNYYTEHAEVRGLTRSFLNDGFGDETQTLESSIMDMADDISYSIHDLEDFLLMGGILNTDAIRSELKKFGNYQKRIQDGEVFDDFKFDGPLGDLARRLEIDYAGWFDHKKLCNAAKRLANDTEGIFSPELPAGRDAAIHTWASNQVEQFLTDLKVYEDPMWEGGPHIGLPVDAWHEVQILKFITKHYVIQHPDMALLQRGQESILTDLIDRILDWNKNDQKRLPERLLSDIKISKKLEQNPKLRGYKEGQFARGPNVERAFVDYVCNLTDEECSSVFRKLSGISVHHPFGYLG